MTAWLGWDQHLKEYFVFMRYTTNGEHDAFVEDVQLLLADEDLSAFNDIVNEEVAFRENVADYALRYLTSIHCPPGTRELLMEEISKLRKPRKLTVRGYAQQFRGLFLEHGENEPILEADLVRMFKSGMSIDWQVEVNRISRRHNLNWSRGMKQRQKSCAEAGAASNDTRAITARSDSRNHHAMVAVARAREIVVGRTNQNGAETMVAAAIAPVATSIARSVNVTTTPPTRPRPTGQGRGGDTMAAMQAQISQMPAMMETIKKRQDEEYAAMSFYRETKDGFAAFDTPPTLGTGDDGEDWQPRLCCLDRYRRPKVDGSLGKTAHVATVTMALSDFSRSRACVHTFRVAEQLLFPIILGNDFLVKQGITLNFMERTLKWDGNEIPMATTSGATARLAAALDGPDQGRMEIVEPSQVDPVDMGNTTRLSSEEKHSVMKLLEELPHVCSGALGTITGEPYKLPLVDGAQPLSLRPYPIPRIYYDATRREVQRLVQLGVLVPDTTSRWASPSFVLPKKDGSVRLVTDFRRLNKRLMRHYFPLPRILEVLRSLPKPRYVLSIHVSMTSRAPTAVGFPFGKFVYLRLPMGVATAPDEFQAVMNAILGDLESVWIYLDDRRTSTCFARYSSGSVIMGSQYTQRRASSSQTLLTTWATASAPRGSSQYTTRPSHHGPDTPKNAARCPLLRWDGELLPGHVAAASAAPLAAHGAHGPQASFSEQQAFEAIRDVLANTITLAFPDPGAPFHIYTDASGYRLGAVITQHQRLVNLLGQESQQVGTVKHRIFLREFRGMLLGQELHIHTDHLNRTHAMFNNVFMLRWRLEIEEFGATLHYGAHTVVADALSRLPTQAGPERKENTVATMAVMAEDNTFSVDLGRKHNERRYAILHKAPVSRQLPVYNCWWTKKKQRIIVPPSLRSNLMDSYHDWLIHPGAGTMYATMAHAFACPNIERDVKAHVQGCRTCYTSKHPTMHYGKLPPKTTTVHPWFKSAVHSIGPYGPNKLRAIRCSTDRVRKQLQSWTAIGSAAILALDVAFSEFKKEFAELSDSYGVEAIDTSVSNPQANAVVE
ncbi:TPA: LOW QUALITY PROTEIN: hypothetical protein N0F65_010142 [Lagenidium giganteum]|uniref:Polyprotein n=1 Tax=Lagenidium giganteum TaxID=4803 RepID=A0AAV2Z4X3_9STRA|nr:TPA: LOW QUALITY PROTEIN: hypothetical protein N0F65_010142 [Lagenidium giganteum]